MSINADVTEEELDLLYSSSVVAEETIKRRNNFFEKFKQNAEQTSSKTWEDIKIDQALVERLLISHLAGLRVTVGGEQVRPKTLYFENILSHLKTALSSETGFDFANRNTFPNLYLSVPQLKKKIKQDGRGNVSHTKPVPNETLVLIYEQLSYVQALMKARDEENQIQYDYVLEKLCENYR